MNKGIHSGQPWQHNPGDLGAHGESHTMNPDGSGHHTLYRQDGSRASWNTNPTGDYSGGGHTVPPGGGKPKSWG